MKVSQGLEDVYLMEYYVSHPVAHCRKPSRDLNMASVQAMQEMS